MPEFKEWREFWGEVVRMWSKKHGFTLTNCLKFSFPIAALSLFGLLYGLLQSKETWQIAVSSVLLGMSTFILFFTLCFLFPYVKWSKDTRERDARISELIPLEEYKKQQVGHEQDWLHLVVEYIDLIKRQNTTEDQITVRFNFDSGLVYAFQPARMWVSPILGGYEAMESQHEVIFPPNFLPGKRSQLSTMMVTIKDKRLIELIGTARV
ncbi:MAG: hypothetical protein NTZ04_02550 [Chloroflexi bacterium]|nr:hypothetical protein [Chloroflexota bacterium]